MSTSVPSSNRFPELEKYELLKEVGHGGMATVYQARDLRLGRQVAVKVIHKHLRENAEVRRRFVSEARAVAKLRHRGIVEVFDVSDEEDEERYLVVELIRGPSLRQLLQRDGAFPPEIAATMVAILCDAVEHAHQSGVIHRDIKPENVLIELPARSSDDGDSDADPDSQARRRPSDRPPSDRSSVGSARSRVRIKLTDFGIAKVLDAQGVTSTGQILGSPAHMAPEQIEGGRVGPHTDVFALGVLMYEAMVGHLPFEGNNPAQVLRRVLECSFEPADTERAAVGGRWARVIAAALVLDIDARLASAAELRQRIEQELSALGIEDAKADMLEYFLDADAYQERIRDDLVPRLLKRGEKERRAGHVQRAAADFNRALALRPDDLSILKRVSALSAETVWKERGKRVAAISLASLALGGAAFGVTRLVSSAGGETVASHPTTTSEPPRTTAIAPTVSTTKTTSRQITSSTSASPDTSASAQPSDSSSVAPPTHSGPATTAPTGSASAEPVVGDRSVVFRIWPKNVTINVGGRQVRTDTRLTLPVGSHAVTAHDPCCEPVNASVTVVASEEDRPQLFPITLVLKRASVSLVGAPPGGSMSCSNGLRVAAGGSGGVRLGEVQEVVSCTFSPSGSSRSVTLLAGRATAVQWQ